MYRRGILRQYASLFGLAQRVVDVMALVAAAVIAHWLRFGVPWLDPPEKVALLLAVLVYLWSFESMGLYRSWRNGRLIQEIGLMLLGLTSCFVALTALGFMLKQSDIFSRAWIGLWFLGSALLLVSSRIVLRTALRKARAHGYNIRQVVIVGAGQAASKMCTYLLENPTLGLRVQAALGLDGDCSWADPRVATRLPMEGLNNFMATHTVDEVWIALPLGDKTHLLALLNALRDTAVNIRYIADVLSLDLLNYSVTELGGQPLINLTLSPMEGPASMVKRLEDLLLGGLFLILASPLMLAIAGGVKLSSPGPVLFRQKRVGWSGRIFVVFKFRTMKLHQEAPGTLTQAQTVDPRVTPFGRFLRRMSLDELPQLFNVLRGDMSLVGPRPHALEHHKQFISLVPRYAKRHLVKPGLTGWAQIHGYRGETETPEKMAQRVAYDVEYIKRWGVGLDVAIILRTIPALLKRTNAY